MTKPNGVKHTGKACATVNPIFCCENAMDLCFSTTTFGYEHVSGISFETALETIQKAGWSRIEISRKHLGVPEIAKKVEASGLDVWAVHGNLGGGSTSLDETERRDAVNQEIRFMEAVAGFAPCPYVVHYLYRCNDPRRLEAYRKSIDRLGREAAKLGFILAVETAPYKPEKDQRYPDSAEIVEFVRSFSSEHIAVCVDINHSNLKENLDDVFTTCRGRIVDIHVSDNGNVCEEHLPPGEGKIDIPAALRKSRESGYTGPCNVEIHLASMPPGIATLHRIKLDTEHFIEKSYLI
jgi:sugar phosphate isomerase/epimerase